LSLDDDDAPVVLDLDGKCKREEGASLTFSDEAFLLGSSTGRDATHSDKIIPSESYVTALKEVKDGTLERTDDAGLVRSLSILEVPRAMRDLMRVFGWGVSDWSQIEGIAESSNSDDRGECLGSVR